MVHVTLDCTIHYISPIMMMYMYNVWTLYIMHDVQRIYFHNAIVTVAIIERFSGEVL